MPKDFYLGGSVTASSFAGDGSALTNVPGGGGVDVNTLTGTSNAAFLVSGTYSIPDGSTLGVQKTIVANTITQTETLINLWSNVQDSNGINGVDLGNATYIYGLATKDSNLYVGGRFYALSDGTNANTIARYDTATNLWSNVQDSNGITGPGRGNRNVRVLAFKDSNLYVGGFFTQLTDGTNANNIARYDTSTNLWSNVQDSNGITGISSGTVYDLAFKDSNLYVGGFFTQLTDGTSANRMAVYDIATNLWSNVQDSNDVNGANGTVYGLEFKNSNLYVGGDFTTLSDGTSANNIARYDTATNLWSNVQDSNGINGVDRDSQYSTIVYGLALKDSKLYVGGNFTSLSGGTTSANGMAVYDTSTNLWSNVQDSNGVYGIGGSSKSVYGLAVKDSNLYVGGNFTTLSDETTSANGIAVYDTSTNLWSSVQDSNGLNGVNVSGDNVYGLAFKDSNLYVGGEFTTLSDGTSANYIAKYDTEVPSLEDLPVTITGSLYSGTQTLSTAKENIKVIWDGSEWLNIPLPP